MEIYVSADSNKCMNGVMYEYTKCRKPAGNYAQRLTVSNEHWAGLTAGQMLTAPKFITINLYHMPLLLLCTA